VEHFDRDSITEMANCLGKQVLDIHQNMAGVGE
jgi:hypothetical protein